MSDTGTVSEGTDENYSAATNHGVLHVVVKMGNGKDEMGDHPSSVLGLDVTQNDGVTCDEQGSEASTGGGGNKGVVEPGRAATSMSGDDEYDLCSDSDGTDVASGGHGAGGKHGVHKGADKPGNVENNGGDGKVADESILGSVHELWDLVSAMRNEQTFGLGTKYETMAKKLGVLEERNATLEAKCKVYERQALDAQHEIKRLDCHSQELRLKSQFLEGQVALKLERISQLEHECYVVLFDRTKAKPFHLPFPFNNNVYGGPKSLLMFQLPSDSRGYPFADVAVLNESIFVFMEKCPFVFEYGLRSGEWSMVKDLGINAEGEGTDPSCGVYCKAMKDTTFLALKDRIIIRVTTDVESRGAQMEFDGKKMRPLMENDRVRFQVSTDVVVTGHFRLNNSYITQVVVPIYTWN